MRRLSILLELERRLEISLPSEAISSRTVGELESFVRAVAPPETARPGATAFYRIRRLLVAAGVPRNKVRPSTPITSLVASGPMLRRVWRQIGAIESELPRLKPHRAAYAMFFFFATLACLVTLVGVGILFAAADVREDVSLAVGFVAMGIVAYVLRRASWWLGWFPPPGIETVRDLVRSVSPESLIDITRDVIARQCPVDLDEITHTTDLARDLGI